MFRKTIGENTFSLSNGTVIRYIIIPYLSTIRAYNYKQNRKYTSFHFQTSLINPTFSMTCRKSREPFCKHFLVLRASLCPSGLFPGYFQILDVHRCRMGNIISSLGSVLYLSEELRERRTRNKNSPQKKDL